MNSVPGLKRAEVLVHHEHQRRVGVLEDAVDDDVVAGQDLRERPPAARARACGSGARVALEVPHPHRRERRGDRGDRALGEHRHVADAERRQPPHGAARGGAEADHRGAQPAAVVPADPSSCERVQDRAVARHLVVLVEDVDDEVALSLQWFIASQAMRVTRRSMASWAISRSWTQCGQPQTTWPGRSVSRSSASGLGSSSTSHCARAPRASAARRRAARSPRRRTPALAVAVLEEHPRAQAGVDALEVRGMDRLPALVGLARRRDDAEGQVGHGTSLWAACGASQRSTASSRGGCPPPGPAGPSAPCPDFTRACQ